MYRAFNTAVTGLQANQTRMEVIGNNIANVNTTGFKSNRATFEEFFAQTLRGAGEPSGNKGGVNPMQMGLGTHVASIDTIFSQGALQTTGKNTDVAIQGKGFLVLRDSQGSKLYSRDGNLGLDASRRLVNTTGLLVQGYSADKQGIINANGPVGDIVIEANRTYPPKATTKVDVAGNIYRPSRLTANEAYAHSQQSRITSGVTVTGFGNAAGQLQLGAANPNTLDAGEFTLNSVSIVGAIPLAAAGETTTTALQKLADLINFHKDKTNVIATVKQAATAGAGEDQIVLTQLQPGPDKQIVVGGTGLAGVTLNGTQLFTAGTTTIETASNNTLGQTTAGSISLISGDILINGSDIGALAATPATNTSEQNAQAIISLINSKTDVTGVTAFSDGNGRISLKATARDIILSGQSVAAGAIPTAATPGGGANVSGLFTGLNRAKTATVIAGTSTEVFDSLGTKHTVGMDFVSDYDVVINGGIVQGTRDAGIWNWAATAGEPNIAVLSTDGNAAGANVPLRSVRFNDQGILSNFSGRFTLNFLNSDAITSNSIFAFNTNLSPNISQPQAMTVDVGTVGDSNGLTQFSAANTLTVATQDGYSAGDLNSFTIAPDGTIRGLFSNGQLLALGKLAMASFVNESGLIRGQQSSSQGGNVYQETPNSGNARIGSAQTAGNGTIIGGALEGSNVDLAEQFTDMIVTQRAFQANSRTITTADEMLQEVLSLRR
jgi:flagellar hook protein FlgE